MKWFSIEGVKTEIGRIRWPKGGEFKTAVTDVLFFTVAFGLFFILCETITASFLRFIGA